VLKLFGNEFKESIKCQNARKKEIFQELLTWYIKENCGWTLPLIEKKNSPWLLEHSEAAGENKNVLRLKRMNESK